jgi:hypothetical protein
VLLVANAKDDLAQVLTLAPTFCAKIGHLMDAISQTGMLEWGKHLFV